MQHRDTLLARPRLPERIPNRRSRAISGRRPPSDDRISSLLRWGLALGSSGHLLPQW